MKNVGIYINGLCAMDAKTFNVMLPFAMDPAKLHAEVYRRLDRRRESKNVVITGTDNCMRVNVLYSGKHLDAETIMDVLMEIERDVEQALEAARMIDLTQLSPEKSE